MRFMNERSPQPRENRFRQRVAAIVHAWHLWIPILIVVLMCGPRLTSLLPAPIDFADEIYQPQQTLKFVASKGQAFDKYGPIPNLFLMPVYGITIVYWKLTGSFGNPSGTWPFGFSDPVRQLGTLILEARLVHLILTCLALAIVCKVLFRMTGCRVTATTASLLVLVSNYNVLWHAPLARPDTAMMALLTMSLALCALMAVDGVTRWRSIALGLSAAAAVGSKENAAPILALMLPCLFVYTFFQNRTDAPKRSATLNGACWTIVIGAIAYAITNIALSPSNWLARMRYWLVGDGLSGDVWARSASVLQHAQFAGEALWNNFGPAGVIVVPALVCVGLWRKPMLTLLLLVPMVGCAVTVFAIPYTPDRFVLPGAVSLVFPVAIGLAALMRTHLRVLAIVLVVFSIIINLWWCSITWHIDATTEQATLERAAEHEEKQLVKAYAVMFDDPPSMRRLAWLGHRVDMRAMQHWMDDANPRPDIVFANAGRIQMIDEARSMPGRAEYYRKLAGFDLDRWRGMNGLGYADPERFTVPLPSYLRPLLFMPLTRELRHRDVLIYRQLDRP